MVSSSAFLGLVPPLAFGSARSEWRSSLATLSISLSSFSLLDILAVPDFGSVANGAERCAGVELAMIRRSCLPILGVEYYLGRQERLQALD